MKTFMKKNKENSSNQNGTKPAWINFLGIIVVAIISGTVTLIIAKPEIFRKPEETKPPSNSEVIIRMYNTDDIAEIYLNDSLIDIFEATEEYSLYEEPITKLLKDGIKNEIKYIIKNETGGWAFSFELLKDGYIYYSRSYGTKYNYRGDTIGNLPPNTLIEHHGANNNAINDIGIVFRDSINIRK